MPETHSGKKQVEILVEQINKIRMIQEQIGLKRTSLLDIKMIVFDNTSSNTGKYNGVGALLEELRRSEFEKEGLEGEYEVFFLSFFFSCFSLSLSLSLCLSLSSLVLESFNR